MSLVPFLSLASFAAAGRPRPNILFSMADQLRFDALSSVTPSLHTPALDALAAEGVRFARAYSTTPTCTPRPQSQMYSPNFPQCGPRPHTTL